MTMREKIGADVKVANSGRWPGPPLKPRDEFSTKPAPAPRGPSGLEAVERVRERRRKEREAGER